MGGLCAAEAGPQAGPANQEHGEERARLGLSATAWRPRQSMSFADWVEQGRRLGQIGRSAGWWIGDWLHYGNAAYGERYVRAARVTGYDVQTLMNMVYVASRVEPSRRREKLSFSHHAEVVALDPPDQERWLERAAAERLSVRCLREEIRRVRRALEAEHELTAPEPEPAAAAEPEGVVCPSCGHAFGAADEQALVAVS